jgi:hypothetical protein
MRAGNEFDGFALLFNLALVIILQRSVRKKPLAVKNTLHRDVDVF